MLCETCRESEKRIFLVSDLGTRSPTPPAAEQFNPLMSSIAIWVWQSFVIFDIRALWHSGLSARVPGCQKLKTTARSGTGCFIAVVTHVATGVEGCVCECASAWPPSSALLAVESLCAGLRLVPRGWRRDDVDITVDRPVAVVARTLSAPSSRSTCVWVDVISTCIDDIDFRSSYTQHTSQLYTYCAWWWSNNNNKAWKDIFFPVAINTARPCSLQAIGARNQETHHCHHRGQQRNHLLVSEAVRGSAEWKIGTFRRPYNLYCVGGDVKHCSIQSNPDTFPQD